MLTVKLLSKNATVPQRKTEYAAGYDLSIAHDLEIKGHGKGLGLTDIAIMTPPGTYARIATRSSLAWGKHVNISAGVIDRDYRGNVGIVIFNHSNKTLFLKKGERVAQLILEVIMTPDVNVVQELPDSVRGSGGFGSTGK